MRIAYLTPTFPPYPGGIGMNCYYNAREMAKRGFEVEVFTPRYGEESEIRNQKSEIKFKIHYLKSVISYGNAALLPQLLWRLRCFDIVHCYYPFFGGAEMAVLARYFKNLKLIIHHEMDVVGEGWQKKFFSWHTRHVLPWILKNSDLVFVLSEDYFNNSDFGRLYKAYKKLPPWQVVPNGVDTELFKPMPNLTSPIVLFAAGLDKAHYFKGVPVLLEAIALLKKENFPVRLRIAGEGELKKEYQKQTNELEIQDQVEFVGLITHDRLPDFYSSGNLFIMPSVGQTESFSIATAEAQACGLPAIVSDLPGMRVTIEDGITGLLIMPGDSRDLARKIKMILSDPTRAAKMGQAGRERMEKMFSWKVMGERLETIYRKLTQLKFL